VCTQFIRGDISLRGLFFIQLYYNTQYLTVVDTSGGEGHHPPPHHWVVVLRYFYSNIELNKVNLILNILPIFACVTTESTAVVSYTYERPTKVPREKLSILLNSIFQYAGIQVYLWYNNIIINIILGILYFCI